MRRVLIHAQIGAPLSGLNRETFAHFETYRFWTLSGHWLCTAAVLSMPVSAPIKVLA